MSLSECSGRPLWDRAWYITFNYYKTFSAHTTGPLQGVAKYDTSELQSGVSKGGRQTPRKIKWETNS